VRQAKGGCVERQRRAERERPFEPGAHERRHIGRLADSQHADRDLRAVAEERGADGPGPRPDDLHHVAAGGVPAGDVGAIDPGMAGADALLAARGNGDG
jgi:hypothetical protein